MLDLKIQSSVLTEGQIVYFRGATMEMSRLSGDQIQVNTCIYLEQDGRRSRFATYNRCDVRKNCSIEKRIVCEPVESYTMPEETGKNEIIYYLPKKTAPVAVGKLSRRRRLDYFDGAFPSENVLGCEYFAFLREPGEQDYMVLLSVRNLNTVRRGAFVEAFGGVSHVQKDAALFQTVFAPGRELLPRGGYLGVSKISDIYATEAGTFFEQAGRLYEYTCLEKFDSCGEGAVRNTRFFRSCRLTEVERFLLPEEQGFAMMDCYLPVSDKTYVLRPMTSAQYGKYVPFPEAEVRVAGCPYFAAVLENRVDPDSENVLYPIVEAYKKTRYKKLRNTL